MLTWRSSNIIASIWLSGVSGSVEYDERCFIPFCCHVGTMLTVQKLSIFSYRLCWQTSWRLKGAEDDAAIGLQAAGGLHHLMANHWQVLVKLFYFDFMHQLMLTPYYAVGYDLIERFWTTTASRTYTVQENRNGKYERAIMATVISRFL
jgi:hypothetical protein